MYILKQRKVYRKKPIIDEIELNGFYFGNKGRTHLINGCKISNLIIYQKKFIRPIALKKVNQKYQKLLAILPDLIVSDEGDGESIREALNKIERFRQIIKNEYREYLKKQELEIMAKNLELFQKEAQKRFIELNRLKHRERTARSSSK